MLDPRVPFVHAISTLEDARKPASARLRREALERAGTALGQALRAGPRVAALRTLPTSAAPYPTRFGFNGAVPALVPGGLLIIQNRSLLIQVQTAAGLKNVLFNPTDGPANQATPFYERLNASVPSWLARPFLPGPNRCAQQLSALGLSCADIDLIAFDHFHTQDLRPLLGTETLAARFPNAYLLAPRAEWEEWDDLPMLQRAWFVPNGKHGIPEERVVLFDADVSLGDGVALVRTPGHTRGNQTLFVHTEQGVFGCSENGIAVDNWSPRASRLPGLRRAAEALDLDVMVNANTPEDMVQQQESMLLERAIVDRVPGKPELVQMFPSSELAWSPLAPHVRATHTFGALTSGELVRREAIRPTVLLEATA